MNTHWAASIERRPGYRSWVARNEKRSGWVMWRESDDLPAFPSYYRTKREALIAKSMSDAAAEVS